MNRRTPRVSSLFQVGQSVWVPAAHLGTDDGFAMRKRVVREVRDRSVLVDHEDGSTVVIPSSKAHADVGVLVLSVGDLATETSLIDPLSKSVLQYLRLLLPDDQIRRERVRTMAELSEVWATNHGMASHVVLIAHGGPTAVRFVDPGWVDAAALRQVLEQPNIRPKEFLSLACLTGRAEFAKPFSLSLACRSFLGPFQSVHGALASQYCQSFFTARFLAGKSTKVAYRTAAKGIAVGTHFRLWRDGKHEVLRA